MEDESSVMMEPMVDFWGVELSSKSAEVSWPDSGQELEPDVTVRLELRQACLGAAAKPGERNVVELTAEDESGEDVTHALVSLTVGGTEQTPLFLEVFPPVTFRLAAGSGPVHLVGNIQTELEDFDSEDEDEKEFVKTRKRTAESPPGKLAKSRKIVKENGDSIMDQVDSEDEEDEEEEEDDESELEDEESDEEEEEEVEQKTPQKPAVVSKPKAKSMQKPQKPTVTKAVFKTPQPQKGNKTVKTSSAPTTPQQGKTTKKAKVFMSMEDMKAKLEKTPSLPKKFEKFGKYVQQNYKVTDDKMKKQLWDFIQKARATK